MGKEEKENERKLISRTKVFFSCTDFKKKKRRKRKEKEVTDKSLMNFQNDEKP